jgi:hydrogenase nickel incorporation protein HypA/HybF
MHELSIALSIVEMAEGKAQELGGVQIEAVHLKLGALSGVVKDALLFSYELACDGTPLAGSRLIIEDVPLVAYCSTCQAERTLDSIQRFCCPVCESSRLEVTQGKELEVVALEINHESTTATG